jgi:hypothetical protein
MRRKRHGICVECACLKRKHLDKCPDCGFDPKGNDLATAKSILLSESYYLKGKWHHRSEKQIERLSENIRAGEPHPYSEADLKEVLEQKKLVESVTLPRLLLWFLKEFWLALIVVTLAVFLIVRRGGC